MKKVRGHTKVKFLTRSILLVRIKLAPDNITHGWGVEKIKNPLTSGVFKKTYEILKMPRM